MDIRLCDLGSLVPVECKSHNAEPYEYYACSRPAPEARGRIRTGKHKEEYLRYIAWALGECYASFLPWLEASQVERVQVVSGVRKFFGADIAMLLAHDSKNRPSVLEALPFSPFS